jgi:hypothetical protein
MIWSTQANNQEQRQGNLSAEIGAEIKCKKVDRETQETTEFFPVVSRSWRFPLIHVGELT